MRRATTCTGVLPGNSRTAKDVYKRQLHYQPKGDTPAVQLQKNKGRKNMRNTLKATTLERKFPLLAVENGCIISKAVSYTHLDVYKRQESTQHGSHARNDVGLRREARLFLMRGLFPLLCFHFWLAVSYTHLHLKFLYVLLSGWSIGWNTRKRDSPCSLV